MAISKRFLKEKSAFEPSLWLDFSASAWKNGVS
jgi:hypothetical protein